MAKTRQRAAFERYIVLWYWCGNSFTFVCLWKENYLAFINLQKGTNYL